MVGIIRRTRSTKRFSTANEVEAVGGLRRPLTDVALWFSTEDGRDVVAQMPLTDMSGGVTGCLEIGHESRFVGVEELRHCSCVIFGDRTEMTVNTIAAGKLTRKKAGSAR